MQEVDGGCQAEACHNDFPGVVFPRQWPSQLRFDWVCVCEEETEEGSYKLDYILRLETRKKGCRYLVKCSAVIQTWNDQGVFS